MTDRPDWYRRTYDALAKQYDFDDFPFYANEQRMTYELLERHVPPVRPSEERRAVDLGCGTGVYTRWLLDNGYHVVAVDVSPAMLARCADECVAHRDRLVLVQGDLVTAKVPAHDYTVALLLGSVINHVERWDDVFARVAGLLAPRGVALLDVDNLLGLHQLLSVLYSHALRRPGRRPLRDVLARARHAVTATPFHTTFPIETAAGMRPFPFTYLPYRATRRLVRRAGLTPIDARGVNAFSSLLPSLALSEIYRGGKAGRAGAWLAAFDRLVARWIVRWAGLQFLVCAR